MRNSRREPFTEQTSQEHGLTHLRGVLLSQQDIFILTPFLPGFYERKQKLIKMTYFYKSHSENFCVMCIHSVV